MTVSQYELHPDRLATTDERGGRVFLYPADVKGIFRRARIQVQFVLIFIFLILPWIRVNGRQALLFNIVERKFEFFGLSLRAHNAPLLLLVLGAAGFGLFFITSIFGRVWCGWACPQTVFIDGVFRKIERWTEGPALTRRKLHAAPISIQKVARVSAKWALYVLATLVLTHSFLAYFVGTESLAQMMTESPRKNWGNFLFMIVSSAIILFDFAWFREQFCTLVCPYGRFQSVLMDKRSMVVSYNVARAEPRATPQAKVLAKTHNSKLGDCVNCYRCVQVCPTGIDIRRGTQLECIACTACIDACDEVMRTLKKPTGLIHYKSQFRMNFRSGIYLALCVFSLSFLAISLVLMKPVDIEILRAHDTPYSTQVMENGNVYVVNHFKIELSNQSGSDHELVFSTTGNFNSHDLQLITAVHPLPIADGKVTQTDVFIRFPKSLLQNGVRRVNMIIQDKSNSTEHISEYEKEVTLVGPFS